MIEAIIERAGFFIAGGIVAIVILLIVGVRLTKALYWRIARGY